MLLDTILGNLILLIELLALVRKAVHFSDRVVVLLLDPIYRIRDVLLDSIDNQLIDIDYFMIQVIHFQTLLAGGCFASGAQISHVQVVRGAHDLSELWLGSAGAKVFESGDDMAVEEVHDRVRGGAVLAKIRRALVAERDRFLLGFTGGARFSMVRHQFFHFALL